MLDIFGPRYPHNARLASIVDFPASGQVTVDARVGQSGSTEKDCWFDADEHCSLEPAAEPSSHQDSTDDNSAAGPPVRARYQGSRHDGTAVQVIARDKTLRQHVHEVDKGGSSIEATAPHSHGHSLDCKSRFPSLCAVVMTMHGLQ